MLSANNRYNIVQPGRVAEWSKAQLSKSCEGVSSPWVRIPPLPPSRIFVKSKNMSKKVLILYTSIGLGHQTIAENIGWHLEQEQFQVKLADILEVQSGGLVNFGTKLHSLLSDTFPFIWKWLYTNAFMIKVSLQFRTRLASKHTARTKKIIDEYNPDLIITTQTTASAVIAALKDSGAYKNKFAIAFSDFHLHPFWLYPQADAYLVNIVEQKRQMAAQGISDKIIFVCGITLKPKPSIDESAIKTNLGIPISNRVVLLASGSLGIGSSANGLLNLVHQIDIQVRDTNPTSYIIVCGKNETLQKELNEKNKNNKTKVVGYYTPMVELYAMSDVFVTKPGGLSVAESLQWYLPLFVTHILPGQEELNYEYLKTRKLIEPVMGLSTPDVALKIITELQNHELRNSLIHNDHLVDLVGHNRKPEVLFAAMEALFHNV